MDIRQVSLDLKWIGVGFLDLAIVLRVVSECNCNIKHQLMLETSYPDMETHANLTPVQVYATCMCLPKRKAKKHGHCQKSCQGFGQLFGKGRLFGRPIFKQTLRNYQPCVSTPKTPEQHKECVKQKKTVYLNSCPILYPTTYEEHPINNHDLNRALFWKSCHEWTLGCDDTCRNVEICWICVIPCLMLAVLELCHPNWFGL